MNSYGTSTTERVSCDEEIGKQQTKILIVDDHRGLANMIYSLLNRLNYHFNAFVAYGEQQAYEKILKTEPDIVLCDAGLPNGDAYKLAFKIRTGFSVNNTYLLGLTFNAQDKFKIIAMELAFDCKLAQPSILGDIVNKVKTRKAQENRRLLDGPTVYSHEPY